MTNGNIPFHETDYGNRFLIREGLDIDSVRRNAQIVIDTENSQRLRDKVRSAFAHYSLNRSVIVTMGNYDDEFVSYVPPQGAAMAEILLAGTEQLVESKAVN